MGENQLLCETRMLGTPPKRRQSAGFAFCVLSFGSLFLLDQFAPGFGSESSEKERFSSSLGRSRGSLHRIA